MSRMSPYWKLLMVGLIGLAATPCGTRAAGAESNPRLVASPEPDWPQWRGPRRDGVCTETGLLGSWPAEGPPTVWKAEALGFGYSAPIIVSNRIYITGDVGTNLVVFALDLEGRQVWTATNGASWKNPYPGARASCTYSAGRLLNMNGHAQVGCFDAASGKHLWTVDLRERFGSRPITWATSECLLVHGDRVFVSVGGTNALAAALHIDNGKTLWTTPPLLYGASPSPARQVVSDPPGEPDPPSYASPILVDFGGRHQLIGCSQKHIFGVNAENGTLLWSRPLKTRYEVVAMTPVLVGDAIFATGPDSDDGALHRLRPNPGGMQVEKVWSTKVDTCHGGAVFVNNAIYASWYRSKRGWVSMDPDSGDVKYETNALAKGSVLFADGRLYILSEEGEAALLRPTDDAFVVEGKFRLVPGRKTDVWTHPVIHKGRLYLRYHDALWCYDIKGKAS